MPKKITKILKLIPLGLMIVILITQVISCAGLIQSSDISDNNENKFILLLNSGLVDCQTAAVKCTLWTENSNDLEHIEKILSKSELDWQKEILRDYAGNKAFKYTAQYNVTKERENDILNMYDSLAEKIDSKTTKIYIEEKVGKALDLDTYLKLNHVKIIQREEIPYLSSITGYSNSLINSTNIGNKQINLQIASRKTETDQGKTVLALPILLEEF